MGASAGDPGMWTVGNTVIESKDRVVTVVFRGIEKLLSHNGKLTRKPSDLKIWIEILRGLDLLGESELFQSMMPKSSYKWGG
jgi:hypothetical protein